MRPPYLACPVITTVRCDHLVWTNDKYVSSCMRLEIDTDSFGVGAGEMF